MTASIDLYLASKSPRRRELLQQIGVRFELAHVNVPEERQAGELPNDYVHRLAVTKAEAGASQCGDLPVLGADTIVVLGDRVMEKPGSEQEAIAMLQALSGTTHQVITGVAISFQGRTESQLNTTAVRFREITAQEAQSYWKTGEPADKAGAYGIQGKGAVFVEQISGSYSSVVGLPLLETSQLLETFKVPIWL